MSSNSKSRHSKNQKQKHGKKRGENICSLWNYLQVVNKYSTLPSSSDVTQKRRQFVSVKEYKTVDVCKNTSHSVNINKM